MDSLHIPTKALSLEEGQDLDMEDMEHECMDDCVEDPEIQMADAEYETSEESDVLVRDTDDTKDDYFNVPDPDVEMQDIGSDNPSEELEDGGPSLISFLGCGAVGAKPGF